VNALSDIVSAARTGSSRNGLDVLAIDSCLSAIDRSGAKVLYTDDHGEHAEKLLPSGTSGADIPATKCYMDLDRRLPALRHLLLPEALRPLRVTRVNAYVSPAREGASLHFDSHHVVIVQLVGVKHWEYSAEPAVRRPFRNCVAPRSGTTVDYGGDKLSIPKELIRHTLRPGDWLLLPAATWHQTHAFEYSLSATLAVDETAATAPG
jgi:hypothetical protein